jgi:hypothetical protein
MAPLFSPNASAQSSGCKSDTYIETTQLLPVKSNYALHIYARGGSNAKAYVSVDDSPCLIYSVTSADWGWVSADSDALFENVSASEHTIRIYFGGEQLDIDKLVLTSDTSCDPAQSSVTCIETTPTLELQGVQQGELIKEDRKIEATILGLTGSNIAVTFSLDGAEVRKATSSPYCMYEGNGSDCGALMLSSLAAGEHTIKVILSQAGAQLVEKVISFSAAKPSANTPVPEIQLIDPDVRITGLNKGSTVAGNVTISVALANVSTPAVVRFRIDDVTMSSSSVMPYCMNGSTNGVCKEWDTKSVKNGSHTLFATVSGDGIKTKVASYDFKIENKAPVSVSPPATTTVPVDGRPATTSGVVRFSAPAATTSNSQTVAYSVDKKPIESTTKAGIATYDTSTLTNGTHTVTATVASVNGEKKTYQSTINVNNSKLVSSKNWMQRNKLLSFALFVFMACGFFAIIFFGVQFLRNRRFQQELEQEHNIYNSYQYVQPQEIGAYQQAGFAIVIAALIGIIPLLSKGTSFAVGGRGFIEESELMVTVDSSDQLSVGFDNQASISYLRFKKVTTPTPSPTPVPNPAPTPVPTPSPSGSPLANPFIGGYIEMWGDVQPGNVPAEYDMLFHAFASVGYDGTATLNSIPDPAAVKQQYSARNAAGKPTILSIGGYLGAQAGMTTDSQIQNFISSVTGIIDEYGFSGIDWDLEFDIPGGLSGSGMAEASRQLIAKYGDDFLITAAPFEGIEDEYIVLARLLGSNLTAIGYQFYNMRTRVTADIIKNQIQTWITDADINQNQFAIGFCQDPGGGQATVDESEMAQMYSEVAQTYPNLRGTWVWGIHYIDNVRGFKFAPTMATVVN